jgi:predicted alpha/beta-fold hydrolase
MAARADNSNGSSCVSGRDFTIPPFLPHPLIRGGHAQTLAGYLWTGARLDDRAEQHVVDLDDGDHIVLHDDCPSSWQPTGRVALLLHGLSGSHASGYMVRIAAKLADRHVRVFRMDHRGCGAGATLARSPYHAGRSNDALAALRAVIHLCPQARVSLIGFSLSGNLILKFLGEAPELLPEALDSAMAINPSLDLSRCVAGLAEGWNRLYDRHFVRALDRELRSSQRDLPENYGSPGSLWEFDDTYTAPVCGFGDAERYYRLCSAAQFVPRITLPTLILTSRDDPLIPHSIFERLALPANVRLHVVSSGGHLGYVGRKGIDADRRWMDWRVVDWVAGPA